MAEELLGPDGQPIDIEQAESAFHAAMSAPEPGTPPDYPAPPRKSASAPYGLNKNGSPRARPGRKPKSEAERPRTARAVPVQPAPGKPARPAQIDRKAGVDGVLQLAAGVLVTFPGTRADAVAVGVHGPALSDAVVLTASADDRFGRALDRLLTTGPYAALVMAVVPLAAQIGANHGLLPKGFLGTADPAVLREQAEKSLAEQAGPEAEKAAA